MEPVFRFKANGGGTLPITMKEIQDMSMPEFLQFKDKLVNVRERERYDKAIYEAVNIKAGLVKDIFRKGYGQEDTYATSDTEYKKTKWHTNMHRSGEFEQGSLVIITDISAPKAFFAGKPTTVLNGQVTNAKATFPTDTDPALSLDTWLKCVVLDYREGESSINEEPLRRYPQNDGQSGVIGASQGGLMQNAFMPSVALKNPRTLIGGEDFSVRLTTLHDFDASATGLNQVIVQEVILSTIELIRVPV